MGELRPIDANALKEAFEEDEHLSGYIEEYINDAPTIEGVPVVRCKDCKHRGDAYKCPMRRLVYPIEGAGYCVDLTRDDGYCHYGEKKEDEGSVSG